MGIRVPVRSAAGVVLAVALVAACGPGATPSPRPSASPTASASVESPSPSVVASPSESASAPATTVYVVRKGDTLIAIAKRFHITLVALKKANPLVTDPNKLRIGQKLTIPAP